MYKDLSDCLKKYSPLEDDLNIIINRFLSHSFIHNGGNLYGEQYEAWVYEYLKSWALDCPYVSMFVEKIPPEFSEYLHGLNYDKNGQIFFYRDGKKLAEYDGLFIYKNRVVFVESSVSELRSYYRKLEDSVIKKRELLVELFNTEEVYYLAITRPKKKSLVYRSLPHLVLYKLRDPDFSLLESDRAFKDLEDISSPKLVDLKTISSFSFSSF